MEKEATLNAYKLFLKTCDFNIQIIMESMGGGGHFTAAATQINTNETIDEIMKKLKENINIYIRDGRI